MKKNFRKIKQLPDRRIVLLLLCVTFILRVSYSVYYYYNQPIPRSNLYFELAQEIIEQGKVFYDSSHPYYEVVGPVLPWINAITMLIFGKNYLGLYIITALASALITGVTYKTARLFFDKKTSLFIGVWSAFYLFYFYYTPTPGKDIWMSFFLIYLIYMLFKLFELKQFNYLRYFWFIIVFVISFHLDERFFVFTPFLFIYILYCETDSFTRFELKKSMIFAVLVIILIIPWTIRNYNKHDKIVIISTRTEAFTDKVFSYESRGHLIDKYNDIYGVYYIHDYQIDSVRTGKKTKTDGGRVISPQMIEAMNKGKLPRPLKGIRAAWVRTKAMFEPFQLRGRYERTGYFYYKKSLQHNLATFIFYGILFIFSFYGFYRLFRESRRIFYILFSVITIYALIHALTISFTNWRYRLPLDSIFIITGCYGILTLYQIIKKKIQSRQNKTIYYQ